LRWAKAAGAMGPSPVVVLDVCRQNLAQVSLVDDQHAVGEFGSQSTDEPFREAVRPWAARRNSDHSDANIGQDSIEGCGELAGAVPDEEPELAHALTQVHHQVADLPRPGSWSFPADAPIVCRLPARRIHRSGSE
jgi:hypothetical protein